jgi:hypothetical protein
LCQDFIILQSDKSSKKIHPNEKCPQGENKVDPSSTGNSRTEDNGWVMSSNPGFATCWLGDLVQTNWPPSQFPH